MKILYTQLSSPLILLLLLYATLRASFSAANESTGIANSLLPVAFKDFYAFGDQMAQTSSVKCGSQSQIRRVTSPPGVLRLGECMNIFREQTTGHKVRMDIPIKHGFKEFKKAEYDPRSLDGFSGEVFNGVMKTLPKQISYDFIPFEEGDGDNPVYYEELTSRVYCKEFDGAVGDTVVSANRSEFVDLTYMEAASLSLCSFWSTYVIIAITSLTAILIYFLQLLYRNIRDKALRETCMNQMIIMHQSHSSVTEPSADVKFHHKFSLSTTSNRRTRHQFSIFPSTVKRRYLRFCIFLVVMTLVIVMAMHYQSRSVSIQTRDNVQSIASKNAQKVSLYRNISWLKFSLHANSSRLLLSERTNSTQTAGKEKRLEVTKSTEHVNYLNASSMINEGFGMQAFDIPVKKVNEFIDLYRNQKYHHKIAAGVRESPKIAPRSTVGLRLKIVVPVKKGFNEFIKVYRHPRDHHTIANGFVVAVFKEVMAALPYQVSWEFIPYETSRQDATGYYDKLIYQLSLKEKGYDGVVGDITMTANRSKYGDFSLPFMSSKVSMIVPKEGGNDVNSLWWIFKPLSVEMWIITFTFFLLKGFLIWFLEHKTNREFQGTTSEQVGTIVSFSFAIFTTAQKGKLQRMSSRFIIDLWGLMMFVIAAVYNANLSLLLSNGMPQPTSIDLKTLIENGDFVGYQNGSFIFELLKQWGFHESKLKAFATKEEYAEALSLGSRNNGVSAVIDEIPYVRVFLARYGHQYAMGGLKHFTTGGFGFVFPKGSKLAQDVSDAILQLEESGTISRIKKRCFKTMKYPSQPQTLGTFKKLGIHDFLGLFLITGLPIGAVPLLPLMIWLYKSKRDVIKQQWENIKIKVSSCCDSLVNCLA